MEQHDLNRAIANVTQEPVGLVASLGFSLLILPPVKTLSVRPQRRMYPLRLAHQARKSRPRRCPAKKSVPTAKPIVRRSGKAS